MGHIIAIEALEKTYDNKRVLKNISLAIERKEIFGLLGPSGAGKTTMIKILTGQLMFEQGNVSIFQQPVSILKEAKHRRRIGILSDNSGLYVRLSIEENLLLYCHLYHLSKTALKEALDFVGLYEERKKKVRKLSKGMFQRVILARAILHQPDILFLDEPTSSLDPASTAHIHRGLRQLNERGTTIFLTTHDMLEAEQLCDRVAFLHEGEIAEIGTPKALKGKFSERVMMIELLDGTEETILIQPEYARKVYELMKRGAIKRIVPNEPNLGEVFLRVTGRELV